LHEEILQLDQQILQHEAEKEYSQLTLAHAEKLHEQKALSGEQLMSERMKSKVAALNLDLARAQKRSREAEGTAVAETELARHGKELADEQSKLKLLEAGGRPEEVEAERARLARLVEERAYLERTRDRLVLRSPAAGVITTPRMKEKNGQYVATGTVVCVVEDLSDVSVEISISELSVLNVQAGQLVELRARALPLQTFQATVERKAPSANVPVGQTQGTVTVYCRLSQGDAQLLSGMTGYARIYREHRPVGFVMFDRLIKYLRTEFWWW
jgi:multidrug resistance efflux pump